MCGYRQGYKRGFIRKYERLKVGKGADIYVDRKCKDIYGKVGTDRQDPEGTSIDRNRRIYR
jgi:hypothetical protein